MHEVARAVNALNAPRSLRTSGVTGQNISLCNIRGRTVFLDAATHVSSVTGIVALVRSAAPRAPRRERRAQRDIARARDLNPVAQLAVRPTMMASEKTRPLRWRYVRIQSAGGERRLIHENCPSTC